MEDVSELVDCMFRAPPPEEDDAGSAASGCENST